MQLSDWNANRVLIKADFIQVREHDPPFHLFKRFRLQALKLFVGLLNVLNKANILRI